MDKIFSKKNFCCGCTACYSACPKQAITMAEDEQGFLYPEISGDLCVDCGICKSVCAFQNGYNPPLFLDNRPVYAMKNKDEKTRSASSSGGVFPALAVNFLKKGGVVYGAGFDNNFDIEHIRISSGEEISKLQGSKYVQSKLENTFAQVENDLKNGIPVMFTGTGCQIQGLRESLKKDYDNLFLVDIICHGAPSPKVFRDYKALMEKKHGSKIKRLDFRGKKIYSETQDMYIEFENGKAYSEFPNIDMFISLFAKNLTLRPSCYECVYTNTQRPSDITLGDYWGIRQIMPEFDDKKGVSILIANTKKGADSAKEILPYFNHRESSLENALQPNLKSPTKRPDCCDDFWRDYRQQGLEYVYKKYTDATALFKIKRRVKNKIKKALKK